jgi:crotonobetainyl-CoA:carnitine CoA-transferase CaiB-like acyl-CoA transferase
MYIGPWAATHGYVPPRMPSSAHSSIVPFQNFEAKDGWFVVAAAKQKFWERLCEVTGHPELNEDPRFATMAGRHENRHVLVPILEGIFRERTVAEWLDLLVPAGVPSAKINSVLEALGEEQTVARGGIVEHEHPTLGTVRTIASPLRLSDEHGEDLRDQPPRRGPFRGEHTEQVLVDYCGYSSQRVRELAEAGVFGDVAVSSGPAGART